MQIEQALNSENFHIPKPRKALNNAFLKVKPNRTQIEGLMNNLIEFLDRTNDTESEEFYNYLIIDFVKKIYYETNHFIKTVKAEIERVVYRFYDLTEKEIGDC